MPLTARSPAPSQAYNFEHQMALLEPLAAKMAEEQFVRAASPLIEPSKKENTTHPTMSE
jgi:hypothetical protein